MSAGSATRSWTGACWYLHLRLHSTRDRRSDRRAAALRGAIDAGGGGGHEVRIGAGPLIPDVLVVDADAFWRSSASLEPAHVLLVVEVVSPSSLTSDRITEPALYAAAHIRHYWRIETADSGGPMVITYRLDGNVYAEEATVAADGTGELDEPFRVTLIPSALSR